MRNFKREFVCIVYTMAWFAIYTLCGVGAQGSMISSIVDALEPVPNLSKEETIEFKEDILSRFIELRVPMNGKKYSPVEVFRIASDTTMFDAALTSGVDTSGGVITADDEGIPDPIGIPAIKSFVKKPLAPNTLNYVNGRIDISDAMAPDGSITKVERDMFMIGSMYTSRMIYYMYRVFVYSQPSNSPREFKKYDNIMSDAIPYFDIDSKFKHVKLTLCNGIVRVVFPLKITTRGNKLNTVEIESMPYYSLYHASNTKLSIKDAENFYNTMRTEYLLVDNGEVLDPVTWTHNISNKGQDWLYAYYTMDDRRSFNLMSGFYDWGLESL